MENNIKKLLETLGLDTDNSILIGSGILSVLGIRESNDIDVVVDYKKFEEMKSSEKFTNRVSYGEDVLVDKALEIRKAWNVLGDNWNLEKLLSESEVIDGVRYITIDFLLKVKKDWAADESPRQKDIRDAELIEQFIRSKR